MLGIANATAPEHGCQEKSDSPTVCLSARQHAAMCCPQWRFVEAIDPTSPDINTQNQQKQMVE